MSQMASTSACEEKLTHDNEGIYLFTSATVIRVRSRSKITHDLRHNGKCEHMCISAANQF